MRVCEWMSAAVRNRGRRRELVDLWMLAWSGRFAERSGRLTQLARCTALCSARRSGGLRAGTSLERVGRCAIGLGDPRVSLNALCRWEWRRKHLAGRVRRRYAVGSCVECVTVGVLCHWDSRRACVGECVRFARVSIGLKKRICLQNRVLIGI